MTAQLALELPVSAAYGRDDFLPGPSNERALAAVESWPRWPDRLLAIEGPAGSGKTHLASIWAERADAVFLSADALRGDGASGQAKGAAVLEDLDRVAFDEDGLFHFLNRLREGAGYLLLTTATPLGRLPVRRPDLASRLRLAPIERLGPPDDALLGAVLLKHFSDRQIAVDRSVIAFLAGRVERSFASVATVAADLDREALRRGRRITRHMAAAILGQQLSSDEADEGSDADRNGEG